jgi:predicted MFS family arabinose efflux permease
LMLPTDTPSGKKRPFDMPGFLLISPGLAILLYGVDHVESREGLIGLLAGLLMIGAFVRHALRKADTALIDVRLFRNRIFAAAARTQFLSNGATFAGQMLIPLYLIGGCGFSAAKAGWMLAPMGIGMLFVYPSMGYLTERFGCRAVAVTGTILSTLGTLPFLWMADHRFVPTLMVVALMVRGVGQSGIGLPSITAAYASVPKEKLALATTAANIVQRVGGPIATTALALLMSFAARHFPAPGPHAFVIPFTALVGLQLLVFTSANWLPARIPQNGYSQDNVPENHESVNRPFLG